jgi:hypothetical protein
MLLGIKDIGNCEIGGDIIEFATFLLLILLLLLTYCCLINKFLFFCYSNLLIKKLLSYFNSYNLSNNY